MTSDSKICPTCGKSTVADPANPGSVCAGHPQAAGAFAGPSAEGGGQNLKAALDAIKTPGAAGASPSPAAAAKPAPAPVPKSALDSIPTPGAAKPAATPAAPVSGVDLKAQLDAIGTPAAKPPTPAAPAAPVSPSGIDLSALNSIPTPGVGAASAPANDGIDPNIRNMMNELNSIPTPTAGGGGAAQKPLPADAPQWMKNYAQYQSSMTSSPDKPFGAPEAYTPSNRDKPNTSSGYLMIAVLVIVMMGGFFAFVSMTKPAPVQFNDGKTTTTPSGAPASPSYAESTPITPGSPNYTPPAQSADPNSAPNAMPNPQP